MGIKLHYNPLSTFSRRVLIALAEKQIPHELVVVDMAARQHRQQPYLSLNPYGRVPTLEEDGFVLFESTAILNYLADKFPESKLGGDGTPKGRAEVNRWLGFLNADVHPAFHPLFGTANYLGEEAAGKMKDAARKKLRGYF